MSSSACREYLTLNMNKLLVGTLAAVFLSVGLTAHAAPTPVKVIAEGTTDSNYTKPVPNGKEHDEVGALTMNYTLTHRLEFWNVGAEGGDKYMAATYTVITTPVSMREVVKRIVLPSKEIGVQMKPSSQPLPEPTSTVENWTFSGGLGGTFVNEKGTLLKLAITSDGSGGFYIQNGDYKMTVSPATAFKDWAPETTDAGMRFSGMTGQVEYCLPKLDCDDEASWKLAKLDSQGFPPYTHIRTAEDSTAILSFADMSTFVLKPESHVVLDTPPGPESKVKLVAGNIWANIKKMVKDGSMSVEMNQAVCGIKGTTFVLEETGATSTLKVIEGKVSMTPKSGGAAVMVTDGQTVTATAQGLGPIEKFDAPAESAIWEGLRVPSPKAVAGTVEQPASSLSRGIIGAVALAAVLVVGAGLWLAKRRAKQA